MNTSEIKNRIEQAVIQVANEAMKSRFTKEWRSFSEFELWYELVACILGSNINYEHAKFFSDYLRKQRILDISNCTNNYSLFEQSVFNALSEYVYPSLNNPSKMLRYRYPRIKARHIRMTAESLYDNGNSINNILLKAVNTINARKQLIDNCAGIGPKQSSLFLRNINYSKNVAILDVHVLRYMYLVQLIPNKMTAVTSLKKYSTLESLLQQYAQKLNLDLAYLDIAIWLVMRDLKKKVEQQ